MNVADEEEFQQEALQLYPDRFAPSFDNKLSPTLTTSLQFVSWTHAGSAMQHTHKFKCGYYI
jgi:hypothetical protein